MSPAERAERSRLGAFSSWAITQDRAARTAPARAALAAKRADAARRADEARVRYDLFLARRLLAEATDAVVAAEQAARVLGIEVEQ